MEPPALPAGQPRQVRVSDLLDHRVPIAWHEAVAVVRVLAVETQRQPPPPTFPELSQIVIDTDGRLVMTGGLPAEGHVVSRLRRVLRALLTEGSAPSALVALADDSGRSDHENELEEFFDRLTFFARPDDTDELATLAARAVAYRDTREQDEAMESLKRKARAGAAVSREADTRGNWAISARERRVLLLCLVLAVLLGTVLAWQLVADTAPTTARLAQPISGLARRMQDQLSEGAAALQTHLGLESVTPAPRGRDRELRPAARKRSAPGPTEEREPLPAELAYGLAGPPPTDLEPNVAMQAPRVDEPADVVAQDTAVYSADDPSVAAPTLSRPQMPTERIDGLTQERAGELELLVGVDGRVEQARLVPASNRYQDRMMVSAAKTWRFAPATKDGHPVRYRLRIPITW